MSGLIRFKKNDSRWDVDLSFPVENINSDDTIKAQLSLIKMQSGGEAIEAKISPLKTNGGGEALKEDFLPI